MLALSGQALKQGGFQSDMRLESQEVRRLIITSVQSCSGKSQGSYGDQRKEHKYAHRDKSHDLHSSSADRMWNL